MNRKQRRAGGKVEQKPDALALHAAGIDAFRAGHLENAASLIARAIAANGRMPDFHYNLAIVRKAQNKLPDAAASYQRAIRLKPDYTDAHNNLGNVWKMLGEQAKACASFEQALQLRPDSPDAHYNLGLLCSEAGMREQAAVHFQSCLTHDPDDSRGAAILLAHLGLSGTPDRTPLAQLQKIYDVRAQFWDRESHYFGHRLVADGLHRHTQSPLDILDIGCGTGLVGALIHPLARRMDGVDISPVMLEKARAKGVYDRLEQADLTAFMAGHAGSYDAVLGAATLIHFGNLETIFQAAALCLRPGGLLVFTLFAGESADFAVAANARLAQSGCFQHSSGYVARLAAQSGFAVESLETVVHEYDQNNHPVAGLLAVLRRGG